METMSNFSKTGFDIQEVQQTRKAKYELKSVLKTKDINKTGWIGFQEFKTEAALLNIFLSEKDINYIQQKLCKNGKVNYEELLKDLAVGLNHDGDLIWRLRSANRVKKFDIDP